METQNNLYGAKIRARRQQMGISEGELGGIADLEAKDIQDVENGLRGLSDDELKGIASYLCLTDDFLAGEQSLADLVIADKAETEEMVEKMVGAFRNLSNQLNRRVAYNEIIDLVEGMVR